MPGVPQRPNWHPDDPRQRLTPAWQMWKADRAATCDVCSHQFGWELRLTVGSEVLQTRVVRAEPELNATAIEWREAMRAKGWTLGV